MSDITEAYTVQGLYDDLASEMEDGDYNCAIISVSWMQHYFHEKVRMPHEWAAILMLHDYQPADPVDWRKVICE